jgi:hypothetical protein
MNKKMFQKFIDRDGVCPHCLKSDDTLVPSIELAGAWVAVDP